MESTVPENLTTIYSIFDDDLGGSLAIFAAFIVMISSGRIMLEYLNGKSKTLKEERRRIQETAEIIKWQEKAMVGFEASLLSNEGRDNIVNTLYERIEAETLDDTIMKLRKSLEEHDFRAIITSQNSETKNRIYKEIDSLDRRGSLNLVLGVITAAIGILVLVFFVISALVDTKSTADYLIGFLPRFSIVVLIEMFSFFFLRLYKASLSEIKYFQNEATNIEHKFLALQTALSVGDQSLFKKCISALLGTERNIDILAKPKMTSS